MIFKISNLILSRAIKEYQTISQSQLIEYINNNYFTNQYIAIINLFFYSNISVSNYYKLTQYIRDILNKYFTIDSQFTSEEQEWLIFFIILKVQKEYDTNILLLIQDYESLPDLNSNNLFVQRIAFEVKNYMLSYYTTIEYEDQEDNPLINLIHEINDYPDEIKQYQF